jgi:prepilin-type N-terminal cleavage/methylation domain-containing protein
MPRRTFRSSRGFTLVEMLITVAMIGVLSVVAIAGYRRYVHAAQSSEAKVVMGLIRNGLESYRQDTNAYPSCFLTSTLSTYYPNSTPNDTRWVWERSGDPNYNTCWKQLGVHPDAPVRYGYAVSVGVAPTSPGPLDSAFKHPPTWPNNFTAGTPWYVVAAKNVHVANNSASLLVTSSWDGTIYSEGDGS